MLSKEQDARIERLEAQIVRLREHVYQASKDAGEAKRASEYNSGVLRMIEEAIK